METGSIVWAPKYLRGCFGDQISVYPPATRHGRALAKCGPTMHESSGSLSASPRSIEHSSIANAAPMATPIFWPARQSLLRSTPQWLDKLQPRGVDKAQPRWRQRYLPPKDLRAVHSLLADPRCQSGWARAPRRKHCLGWACIPL